MSDPAGQIIAALNDSIDDCPRCKVCDHQDDAIRAAVAAELDKRALGRAYREVRQFGERETARADRAEIQWHRLRDRMHGLAQQWRGGRAPGPEFGHALEAALTQLNDQTKETP